MNDGGFLFLGRGLVDIDAPLDLSPDDVFRLPVTEAISSPSAAGAGCWVMRIKPTAFSAT